MQESIGLQKVKEFEGLERGLRPLLWLQEVKKLRNRGIGKGVEPPSFEPGTSSLPGRRSTTEPLRHKKLNTKRT